MKIAFLHTAAIHEQTFAELLGNAQAEVEHRIEPAWLARAQADGTTPELKDEVLRGLEALSQAADVVVCTCTTLGPLVDELSARNVFRIDYPMMQMAAASPGRVMLALCLESTEQSSTELLERAYAAEACAPNFAVVRCTNAWTHFENLQHALFEQTIADTIVAAVNQAELGNGSFDCIVLAQASMASAAQNIIERIPKRIKVLRSPPLAVMHALLLGSELLASQ